MQRAELRRLRGRLVGGVGRVVGLQRDVRELLQGAAQAIYYTMPKTHRTGTTVYHTLFGVQYAPYNMHHIITCTITCNTLYYINHTTCYAPLILDSTVPYHTTPCDLMP